MTDEFAKECLHGELRWAREAVLWKLDGPWWPRPDVKLFNILVHLAGRQGRRGPVAVLG
jgi:hypothetical protein